MANSNQNNMGGGTKAPATTYVRQHGPPPRKVTTQGVSTPVRQEQPSGTQQPTRSSAYSASARSEYACEAEASGTCAETSKWRPASSPSTSAADVPEVSTTLESSSSQSGSYVRTHGPPRRSGREGQSDEQGSVGRDYDAGEEGNSRFGGSWGAQEQNRGVADRDAIGSGEATVSGRWKEPATSLAPPPAPTNTRWKEPKEEPKASMRRWKGREEGQMGSGRWGRSVCEQDDVDSGNVAHATQPSPSQGNSWKEEPAEDDWGLQEVEHEDVDVVSASAVGHLEQQADDASSQHDEADDGVAAIAGDSADAVVIAIDASGPPSTTAEGTSPDDPASFPSSFVQQPAAAATAAPVAQPVLRNASWEPQLPRSGDAWSAPSHESQGPVQAGPTSSGGASQPWGGGPWGTPGFSLAANNDQGSSAMASFLGNGPGDARKDRHLPPALRNRTPSEGNQGDASTVSSIDQEADKSSTDVSTQDLVMSGAGGGMTTVSPGCGTDAKAPLYEQQQAPLEEWQQGEAHTSHRAAQDQAAHPVEPELHQRQPIHQSHQVQPAQPLHLHNQPHLDQEYRPSPAVPFSSFQPQDRHKHPMQEPTLHHHIQTDHFRTQPYHNQDPSGRAAVPEHIHRSHFPPEHAPQRQQFNHVQHPHQQMHSPQHGMQQQPQQQPQQQHQQQQQGHPQHSMHAHQRGHQQLPPPTLGNQVAHHQRHQPAHAQQRNHHHQQQDMGRQTSQSQQQQINMQHQQQQHIQQSSAFMMPSPAIGYADPRGARGGALGGLPIQMAGHYHELPQQHQSGMPPPGAYGFQSPETHHKR